MHVLLTGVGEPHRPTGLEGEGDGDRHHSVGLDAGAEATTDRHLVDPDLPHGDAEDLVQ